MTNTFGERLKVTIFGESHGKAIGMVLDGMEAGFEIDFSKLYDLMDRRRPGKNPYTTRRREGDEAIFLSGLKDARTTGSPIAAIIKNEDQKSADYEKLEDTPRPSHADYTARVKYKGYMDIRGSGPFSGRLTAPLTLAGGIARQALEKRGIYIGAHLLRVGDIEDEKFDPLEEGGERIKAAGKKSFPCLNDDRGREMEEFIGELLRDGDSIGSEIECQIVGLPIGLGEPFFSSVEALLSHMIFSIPGVRGISFGKGFEAVSMKGSLHNDQFKIEDKRVKTVTNNSSGINGGITNGMPINFKVAMKPTASIGKSQTSFSYKEKKEVPLSISGRHDPCIGVRAVPVVEAASALVILDLYYIYYGYENEGGRK